jgi:flagellar motor component MotA
MKPKLIELFKKYEIEYKEELLEDIIDLFFEKHQEGLNRIDKLNKSKEANIF